MNLSGARGKLDKLEWPTLSENERERRWRLVREWMSKKGLDCLVVFGLKGREQFDRYLANDRTGGIVIFPLKGELVFLTWATFDLAAHYESSLRGEDSWVNDIRLGANGPGVVGILMEKGYENANIGVVGLDLRVPGEMEGNVPYKTWNHILQNLPQAKFHEVSGEFARLIFVKSDEELQLVQKAAEVGELAAEAMINAARPGASETEIYAAAMNQLHLNRVTGSVSPYLTPMILHSGPDNPSWGAPMWLIRAQTPRTICNGDIIQAEIFPRYGGMEAQLQMAIAVGPLDPVNSECAAIARQSFEAGLKALCPGKTFGEVVEAMEEPLRQAGAWHLTPLIHSLNPLCFIGQTAVGMEKMPGSQRYKGLRPTPIVGAELVIEEGTVWELEPNACFGKHRVNIGGTVIVTKCGAVSLNKLPTELRCVW